MQTRSAARALTDLLTQPAARELIDVIGLIAQCGTDPAAWAPAVDGCRRLVGAAAGGIVRTHRDGRIMAVDAFIADPARVPEEVAERYLATGLHADPLIPLVTGHACIGQSTVLAPEQDLPSTTPDEVRAFHEALHRGSLLFVPQFEPAALSDHASGVLLYFDHRLGADERAACLAVMEAIAPHGTRAAQAYRRLAFKDGARVIFRTIFRSLIFPCYILDEEMTILNVNRAGQRLLEERRLMVAQGERLVILGRSNAEVMADAIASLGNDPNKPRTVVLTEGQDLANRHAATLTPLTLSLPGNILYRKYRRLYFLVIRTMQNAGPIDRAALIALGLTQSEADVAELLASGLTADQIVARRGASIQTVQTQLKAIYAKVGIRGKSNLIRMMDQLRPPTAPQ
ncbi:MAG: helix-turn-helix transcriptional regulator [Alphaproteobacteria bacterium]|nr:helix-turn-helix transcriptional regulator [Alphaproteobacteria bacterium]